MNVLTLFTRWKAALQTARMLVAFLIAVVSATPVFAQANALATPQITEMLKKHSAPQKQAFMPPQALSFIENKGQWQGNSALGTPRFLARTRGANVWVMDDGYVYDFSKQEDSTRRTGYRRGHVVKMRFADVENYNENNTESSRLAA